MGTFKKMKILRTDNDNDSVGSDVSHPITETVAKKSS